MQSETLNKISPDYGEVSPKNLTASTLFSGDFCLEVDMVKIPLSQGKVALIDKEDFPIISLFKWYANKSGNNFYAITHIWIEGKRKSLKMHRLLANAKTSEFTDHINHKGLDNRKSNLRICTKQQNNMNARKKTNASSIYRGVSWDKEKEKWKAYVRFNKKLISLGYWHSEIVAAYIYNKAALKYHKDFANLNKL